MPEIEKLKTEGVNRPDDGAYGDKIELDRLKQALPSPGGVPGAMPPPGEAPPVPPPGQPVKPSPSGPLPGVPGPLVAPTRQPGVAVTAPPQGQLGPQVSGAVTPGQDTLQVLDAMALQKENEAAAEWARQVLAAIFASGQ